MYKSQALKNLDKIVTQSTFLLIHSAFQLLIWNETCISLNDVANFTKLKNTAMY